MTHAPLRSLKSIGGITTETNAVNYVPLRSWLATSHLVLGFFLFLSHLWHTGRAPVAAWEFEKGIDCDFKPFISNLWPFTLLRLDIMGPFPPVVVQKKYIVVAMLEKI
ncbi:hypothetical protein Gotri_000373 [Gossypium trilobum]|uniref:Uncharacterized protein n=1 Tax=Gossypium trilobum TaxID=34281 RepID=A0A7J9FB06_9ROSI|nr:hypothetical protein [Gossypium trilobum]